ncbi:MAG: hypothetical protein RR500_01565 [Bacilli bacterium]
MKQLVIKPRTILGVQAILNTNFEEFYKDYGISLKPCETRKPQTKGKTETYEISEKASNIKEQYKLYYLFKVIITIFTCYIVLEK